MTVHVRKIFKTRALVAQPDDIESLAVINNEKNIYQKNVRYRIHFTGTRRLSVSKLRRRIFE